MGAKCLQFDCYRCFFYSGESHKKISDSDKWKKNIVSGVHVKKLKKSIYDGQLNDKIYGNHMNEVRSKINKN